jgi:tetratricopeptide (TPR) repeat protein
MQIIYIGISIIFLVLAIIIMKFVFFPVNIKAAKKYYEEKKIVSAKKILAKLLGKYPGNAEIHYLLAKCHLIENNKEMALVELSEVNRIGIFTDSFPETEFRETYAHHLYSLNYTDQALHEYFILIQKKPDNINYLFKAARLLEEKKKLRKAAELYQKIITIDNNFEEAYIKLGMIYYYSKNTGEAEKVFTKAYTLNQYNAAASFWLGLIAKERSDYKIALALFEPGLRNPDYKIRALIERGKCYYELGNYYAGIPELERAVRLTKDGNIEYYLDACYYLAAHYDKNKETDKAILLWKTIYSINASYRDVGEKLGQNKPLVQPVFYRSEDRIKDYITAAKTAFNALCLRLLDQLGLKMQNSSEIPGGFEISANEKRSGTILSTPGQSILVWFLRISETITETTVRVFQDKQKAGNYPKGIICSSSGFSSGAVQFASARAIDLISPSELSRMLSNEPV